MNYAGMRLWVWPLTVAAILLFYFIFDPMQWSFMPQCLFHKITGLQCMGCGSQRVVHSLLHGNIAEAFRANALLVCALPFMFFMLVVEINRKRFPRVYARIHSVYFIVGVGAVLVLWLIIRNILSI